MRKISALNAAVLAAFLAGGCSTAELSKDTIDYKSATKAPTLEVPPDLTKPSTSSRFTNSDTREEYSFSEFSKKNALGSENSEVLPDTKGTVELERSGDRRWLVASVTPQQLWPKVKDFWEKTGFVLKTEDPASGVMETDWAENRANIPQDFIRRTIGKAIDGVYDSSLRDKFRTRLEVGSDGKTEISIAHRGMKEDYSGKYKDSTVWGSRDSDPGLEVEMLNRLKVFLGSDAVSADKLAAITTPQDRAALTITDKVASLKLNEQGERAWQSVLLAVDRIGFELVGKNFADRTVDVRYRDPETNANNSGFLSNLAFWKSKVTELDTQNRYRINLQEDGEKTIIKVTPVEKNGGNATTVNRITTLLYEDLR